MMSRKPKKDNGGLVYSTNRDFLEQSNVSEESQSIPANQQTLRVTLDSKQRAGKIVTLVTGFLGNDSDLQDLAKYLKTNCGVGGSAKDYEIIVQGNFKDRVSDLLTKKGYRVKK